MLSIESLGEMLHSGSGILRGYLGPLQGSSQIVIPVAKIVHNLATFLQSEAVFDTTPLPLCFGSECARLLRLKLSIPEP